ncbi:MAG: DUF4199 domain-containing protein [Cyclobacteriaceae bacterium]
MESTTTPVQASVKSGIIIGLVMLIINFVFYFIDYSLLVATWYNIFVLILFFGLIIYFGKQYRKDIGGYMTFSSAFQYSFVTLLICGIIASIGNILLYQVIHPGLPDILVDQQLEGMLNLLDKFGAGDSISAEQLDEMRLEMSESYTVMGQLKGFGFSLIIYAIMALILGAILKKKDKSLDY